MGIVKTAVKLAWHNSTNCPTQATNTNYQYRLNWEPHAHKESMFNKVTNEVPSTEKTEKEQNRSVESPIKRGKFQYKLHPCTEY